MVNGAQEVVGLDHLIWSWPVGRHGRRRRHPLLRWIRTVRYGPHRLEGARPSAAQTARRTGQRQVFLAVGTLGSTTNSAVTWLRFRTTHMEDTFRALLGHPEGEVLGAFAFVGIDGHVRR